MGGGRKGREGGRGIGHVSCLLHTEGVLVISNGNAIRSISNLPPSVAVDLNSAGSVSRGRDGIADRPPQTVRPSQTGICMHDVCMHVGLCMYDVPMHARRSLPLSGSGDRSGTWGSDHVFSLAADTRAIQHNTARSRTHIKRVYTPMI